MTYDADGELKSDGTNTYTWDARRHLTAISGGSTASFVYDAFGRRMKRTIGTSTVTQFVYDRLNPVQELNSSNGVTANLLTGLNFDEYFTRTASSTTSTPLADALGSTVGLVTAPNGPIATSYTYQPFGGMTTGGTGNTNPYQFTGRENDGTGLYFYRARYYSPSFQRFVSQDPIGFAGGSPNLYAYVANDPINLPDPVGLWTAAVGWTFGGGSGWGGGSFTLGLAIDDSGHVAFFGTGGGGAGLGANEYSGLSVSVSNAPCVTDLAGPFANQSFGAGAGLDTNVDVYEGKAASNGQAIIGWGLTVGDGLAGC